MFFFLLFLCRFPFFCFFVGKCRDEALRFSENIFPEGLLWLCKAYIRTRMVVQGQLVEPVVCFSDL